MVFGCVLIRTTLLIICLFVTLSRCEVGHETSLQSYVSTAHKRAFDSWSLLSYGSVRLAKSAIRGRVAVQGGAQLEEFDIGRDLTQCEPSEVVLSTTGQLQASMGAVHNGHIRGGRGSRVSHSVSRACSTSVERATNAGELAELERALLRDTRETCELASTATMDKQNATHAVFRPATGTYSCYSVFQVSSDDLVGAKEWRYEGSPERNLIITIKGRRATVRDFAMRGFNAARTLIVFCGMYGNYQLLNTRIHSSILGPTTSFTAMESIVNGSVVTGSLRGKVVILRNEYTPC